MEGVNKERIEESMISEFKTRFKLRLSSPLLKNIT
jgi:hypothetical protein